MDETLQNELKEFFRICYKRLESGEKDKGEKYKEIDLFQEIVYELVDIANYAFLEYVKLQKLREKAEKLGQ